MNSETEQIATRRYALAALSVSLARARKFAVAANLGTHFVSDLDHLAATVAANAEEQ